MKNQTGFTDAQKNMMLLSKEIHEGLRITGIITVPMLVPRQDNYHVAYKYTTMAIELFLSLSYSALIC